MTRYGMAIDTKHCAACNACSMACKREHDVPDGVFWTKAVTVGGDTGMYTPAGTYPNVTMDFYTMGCQHCDNPACVEVCPTGASYKREDGIVYVNWEECIGCQSCIAACPYDVRTYVEEPKFVLDFKCGDAAVPDHMPKTVEKCTFCAERIDRGESPACVYVCRYSARYFGDLDDPNSQISQILASRDYEQKLTEAGTGPCVYFLK